jgi:hypothetical protein
MNLGQMQNELGMIVKDSGRLSQWLPGWINDAILEVATSYDLPPLALADPYSLTVDTSKWLWLLPGTFHKNLFLAKKADTAAGPWSQVQVYKNPDYLAGKDHTLEGGVTSAVAVIPQGKNFFLGVYPLAEQELNLWFYQRPAILEKPGDICDCIPFNFIPQVIYPKLIIKNFQFIVDQVIDFSITAGPLQYWQAELTKGLHGASGYGPGLLGYFNINFNPPRRTGGRDPIGGRSYRYGSF